MPLDSIASFIKSKTTTANIMPPENPIQKLRYLSTSFLNIEDSIPPIPVPNTPAISPINVTFSIIYPIHPIFIF